MTVSQPSKVRAIGLLVLAEVAAMSLWFVSAAILSDMAREVSLSAFQRAALSSGVQAGFVVGALFVAMSGIADRYDPRRVFAISAVGAGLANAVLLVVSPASVMAIAARVVTGALLAGVYPVGMKIAVGWGQKDRGLLVGLLVGALTLGSAAPHLLALFGGADWRRTIAVASVAAMLAGGLVLATSLGPYHATAARFRPEAIRQAWTNRRVRLAYAGYLGHMWELYAMWAWIGTATALSYGATMAPDVADRFAKITAFAAIASGGIACALAGLAADRIGKANVALLALAVSSAAALATALTFGGPPWLTFVVVLVWGASIVPDSAQFSALVADAAPAAEAGSLLTFQTALGFALTFVTVQATPQVAACLGWPVVLVILAIGPILGSVAMWRLRAMR
jgi:MFS family permease